MSKNIIEEIDEIFRYIKNNYQEGIDYEILSWNKQLKVGKIDCLSSRLKKYCREYFKIPVEVDDKYLHLQCLDYSKCEKKENNHTKYYYRVEDKSSKCIEGLSLYHFSYKLEEEKPANCAVCNELTFEENGRFLLWDKNTVGKDFGQLSKLAAYLHPECAKKYFANKEQPDQNEILRLKEKLLRNLDKVCLGPIGWLANAEVVKGDIVEKEFFKGSSQWKKIEAKIHKVEIEGEEINLTYLEGEIKKEIRQALIQEIKQNPQDYKIEKSTIYELPAQNAPDSFRILKHKSGRRHWNIGIIHFNKSLEKGKQVWAEIEALINGSTFPNTPKDNPKKSLIELTPGEKEAIKIYMEKKEIISLFLLGNWLIEEHKNHHSEIIIINNEDTELQNIQKSLEKTVDKSLNYEQVSGNFNSSNQPKSPNYTPLWIILGVGSGIVLGMLATYLVSKSRKSKN
ncbi:MAG: hypothetical protein MRERC_2c067 [Mycoplasmataceae bacterium RC_NB112A]|nr:MAG: hypothetical protein MRERC_2c067 [Mycoplasmataceae bacterium RC_NB112A]